MKKPRHKGACHLIDTTPFTNKESLHVALLLFNIAADKGAEEINIIQALSGTSVLTYQPQHEEYSPHPQTYRTACG